MWAELLADYWFLLVCAAMVLYVAWTGRDAAKEHIVAREKPPMREFTLQQLAQYKGENDGPIYIGVEGKVYDVTRSSNFYGPGCVYGGFAGREATRAFAKESLDEAVLSNAAPIEKGELTFQERDNLFSWVQTFEMKYPHIGFVHRELLSGSTNVANAASSPKTK